MWSILYYLRNDAAKLKWSQRVRGSDEGLVDKALELDTEWRRLKSHMDKLRHERNQMAAKIGKASLNERTKLIEEAKRLDRELEEAEKRLTEVEEARERVLLSIPNIVHESVPVGTSDEDNVPIRVFGRPKVWRGYLESFLQQVKGFNVEYELIDWRPVGHADLSEESGFVDTVRASKVAGARFYYMFDDLVWLDLALVMWALDILSSKGFKIVIPPYMLRRKLLEGVTSFSDFEDMIYKVEGEDLYLVATAEHPLAALHSGETLPKDELPLLYAGLSPCFRKEAGAHGKDTKGIFRVHQFTKVEQFIYCLPEESWEWHETLIRNAEEMFQKLEIPYRVVNVCSGDLGVVAAKKYDLEAWMPAQGKFREMVSCSNTTDYQSYRLGVRYARARGAPAEGYVHTLNSTAIATSRTITAILENNQEPDGVVRIPKILKKYLELFEKAPKDHIEPRKVKS
ncbi:MAG: serine--tRNA ligase [Thermofilaceae archaeon]|nr:serine--tRNA ligase [Thermofilaceae archaeon]MCX8181110.1 serine--tRNA ligase [Thermofilaceae archaeon]MDW8004884.1 serine--tRNA ligase [Thermofilaceae archaeon]